MYACLGCGANSSLKLRAAVGLVRFGIGEKDGQVPYVKPGCGLRLMNFLLWKSSVSRVRNRHTPHAV